MTEASKSLELCNDTVFVSRGSPLTYYEGKVVSLKELQKKPYAIQVDSPICEENSRHLQITFKEEDCSCFLMADPSLYRYPSPLEGYEGLKPLPEYETLRHIILPALLTFYSAKKKRMAGAMSTHKRGS